MATTKKFRVKHGLDAGNNTISFVNDPVSANDAATKNYVDVQVASAPGDVSNSYLTSTFTTNTAFQSYVANTNSRIDTLEAGGTLVTNAYLTSTFTTNTVFQSALANTNAYIATKTDDTTVLATNTALRTLIDDRIQVANATLLIDDRIQVANADAKYATWTALTTSNTAIRSYVDTEVAALVNSAPVTLNTLNELADALGDDPNFATTLTTNLGQKLGATATVTLTGDVTGSGSFSSNAVSIALTDTNLANTNAYIASVSDAQSQYLQVANVASNTSTSTATFTSGNSTITFARDDSSTYDVNLSTFAMANTSTSTAVYTVANATLTFTRADSSTFDVVIDSASVEVSNTAPSGANEGDMWWDNASGELYIYYSNNWVEAVAQDVTPYANNGTFSSSNNTITFVRTDGSQFDVVLTGVGEVTNTYVTSTFTTNTDFQSFVANTNAYIATKTDDSTVLATNTALRTLIDDRMQVANTNLLVNDRIQVANADAKYATWTALTTSNTAIRSYVDTEVAALVNSAPTTLDTLDELASALGDDANFSTTVLTLIGTKASNSALTSTYVTNTVFQSALANTNSYIATKTDDTTVLATNTALRTLINDRIQVANVTGTYVTNTDFQSALANTNSYIATKTDDSTVLATNTALRTLIDDRVQVANLNTTLADYWPSANVINYTAKYLEVANVESSSISVSNTAPSGAEEGNLWWDNSTGELYVYYSNNWVEAVAQDVTPYANNGTFSSSNNTITFVRTDGSQFDVVLTGVGEVTNAYVTSTFTTNTDFQAFVANTNAAIASAQGEVSNAYLTSTFTTNTTFQSALANTNAYIATKTDDSTVLATNTALRTLIDDRLQVANATATFATQAQLTSTNTAIRSYVDTEISALVNSAPTTLDTLEELATALGDDANFSTTVLTLIGTKASNATLTSTYVTNTVFQSALANTNSYIDTKANTGMLSAYLEVANVTSTDLTSYWPSANIIAYTDKYLEVANSGASLEVGNTTPSSPSEGDLWYDTDTGIINVYIANVGFVESTVTFPPSTTGDVANSYLTSTYVANSVFQAFVANTNAAIASSQGEVSNAYLTSTFTTNTVFQSALANTNSYIATKTDDTVALATNTALRTLIDDRMQVANVHSYVATEIAGLVNSAPTTLNTLDELATALGDDANFSTTVLTLVGTKASNAVFQSALANTNSYIATKTDDSTVLATNTALRTLIDDRLQVANLNTTLADYWPSANIITYTAKYLEVANSSSGAAVTVSNTAPSITANGDLWWDNADGELYIAYSNNWVEAVAQDVTPYTNNASYTTGNTTLTFVRTDGSQYEVYLDLSGVSGEVSNSYLTSTFVTNTDFQSALANTNSYIATKTDDSTVLATNTALRTLIDDRMQVANADSKYATWSSLISTNTAIRSYVDTEVAALVNSAPTTLNTLEELATALGDDANFSTTVLTLIGTKASNATLTSTYVTNTTFNSTVSQYLQVANSTNFLVQSDVDQYLQVANVSQYIPANTSTTSATLSGNTATFTRADSSTFDLDLSGIASSGGGASVTVANTAPSSPTEGDLYFDNELATMFIYYDSSWVEVQPSIDPINPLTYGIDTFTANGTATDFTHTSDTVSADAMLVTVDGIIQRPTTDYTVSNKTVTFGSAPSNTSIVAVRVTTGAYTGVSNATFQSALANTNAYIASVAPSYLEVTSNTTMSAGTKYIVGTRTANVVLTFPTSASLGDEIRILDGTGEADTYGIELNRNGHRIQGEFANVIIDIPRAAGGYVYYNANNGWILTEV
jgi:hypothetical protein